jgi:hypothetical protein
VASNYLAASKSSVVIVCTRLWPPCFLLLSRAVLYVMRGKHSTGYIINTDSLFHARANVLSMKSHII